MRTSQRPGAQSGPRFNLQRRSSQAHCVPRAAMLYHRGARVQLPRPRASMPRRPLLARSEGPSGRGSTVCPETARSPEGRAPGLRRRSRPHAPMPAAARARVNAANGRACTGCMHGKRDLDLDAERAVDQAEEPEREQRRRCLPVRRHPSSDRGEPRASTQAHPAPAFRLADESLPGMRPRAPASPQALESAAASSGLSGQPRQDLFAGCSPKVFGGRRCFLFLRV